MSDKQENASDGAHTKSALPTLDAGEPHIQSRGVTRMEAVYRAASTNRTVFWCIGLSVVICSWIYSLDSSTTYNYTPLVTSYFSEHSSGLATLSIATSIISAISKPFIAKISDITSRPYTYLMALSFYVVGYIIAASARTISAYIVGEVFVTVGSSGLELVNSIVVADLTSLEWRGFVQSLLASSYIVNVWFAGKIVAALSTGEKWRWGYGMFAIIMPVVLGPAIVTLIYLDRKAQKLGIVTIASSTAARQAAEEFPEKGDYDSPPPIAVPPPTSASRIEATKRVLEEVDAFGLILLGFGWSLLLLPFSLQIYAKDGWRNPSMIAMMIVGGLLLVAYFFYELKFAKIPSAPRRILLNKTFICAVIIDFFYLFCGMMRDIYWSSYVYIGKPWSVEEWTYYNNTLTISLCFFAIIAGLIQRWTHRYKVMQIIGLCIKIIGIGISLDGRMATNSTGAMVMTRVLVGLGGSFSVIATQVASQASVPHQDVALVISLLSLWSTIGSSIGAAVAVVVWGKFMPRLLREHLPASATDAQVTEFYNNMAGIRTTYAFDDPMRQGAIKAYRLTLWYLIVPALVIEGFFTIGAACLQTNFYLGKQQNAVTNTALDGSRLDKEEMEAAQAPPKNKFLRFWAGKY